MAPGSDFRQVLGSWAQEPQVALAAKALVSKAPKVASRWDAKALGALESLARGQALAAAHPGAQPFEWVAYAAAALQASLASSPTGGADELRALAASGLLGIGAGELGPGVDAACALAFMGEKWDPRGRCVLSSWALARKALGLEAGWAEASRMLSRSGLVVDAKFASSELSCQLESALMGLDLEQAPGAQQRMRL